MLIYTSFFYLFVACFTSFVNSLPHYNPSQSHTYYFTENSSIVQQYALFITAQSSPSANFFQFTQGDIKYPDAIKIVDIGQARANISLKYQTPLIFQSLTNQNKSCVNQTFLECSGGLSDPQLCTMIAPLPPSHGLMMVDLSNIDCINSNQSTLCTFSLNGTDLVDESNYSIFTSQDELCPKASITLTVEIPILSAYINSMGIVGNGNITFHYRSLTQNTSRPWMVSASADRLYRSSDVMSSITLDLYNETTAQTHTNYWTIIKSQLVRHSEPNTIYCYYTLKYTGIIRKVYVNDYPIAGYSPRGVGLDDQSTINSTHRIPLRPNQLNYISIFGYRINTTELTFTSCYNQWTGGSLIQAQFSTFSFKDTIYPSQDYTIDATTISCPSNCFRCTIDSLCMECTDTFLLQGSCRTICPKEYPIPDSSNVCNDKLEGTAVLMSLPEITGENISITFYNDYSTTSSFALVLSATDRVLLGPTALLWLDGTSLLVESVSTLISSLSPGINHINTSIVSIANSTLLSLNSSRSQDMLGALNTNFSSGFAEIRALYYPIDNKAYDTLLSVSYSTSNHFQPADDNSKLSGAKLLYVRNKRYNYLDENRYYIFEAFLSCPIGCNIQVGSNGRVQLYRNDRTLLFDVDFISRWIYTYDETITGFVHLRLIVTGASFFYPYISGASMNIHFPKLPVFGHVVGPIVLDRHLCSIPNCLNCRDNICMSCDEGYFLLPDKSACANNCGSNPSFIPTRSCMMSCKSNQILSIDRNQCMPGCDKEGYYFDPQQGCILCVAECSICYNASVCSQCRFPTAWNTPTYCARKSGTLYTLQDFNVSQTVSLIQDSTQELAIVIADESSVGDLMLYFMNNVRKVPRIFKAVKIISNNTDVGSAVIPPLTISESGVISVHYIKIQEDNNPLNFSITGFLNKSFISWPIYEEIPEIDFIIGPLSYIEDDDENVNKPSFNSTLGLIDKYQTVVLSKLYQHNETGGVTCRINIQFSGSLRSLYVNGELIIADSKNYGSVSRISNPFYMEANELSMITIVGYKFKIQNLDFRSCRLGRSINTGVSVNPRYDSYLIQGSDGESDNFYTVNNTYCGSSCLSCLDKFYCLKCETDYFLINGTCQSNCTNSSDYQLVNGFCEQAIWQQGSAVSLAYNPSTYIYTLNYQMPVEQDLEILVIVSPFQISLTSHIAYAFDENTNSNDLAIAEGFYNIITHNTSQTQLNVAMMVKPTNSNGSTAFNLIFYTVRRNLTLLYHYNQYPSTTGQLLQATGYDYLPFMNQTLTLEQNYTYFWDFFLQCDDSCHVTFQTIGNIKITQNELTFLFDGYIEFFIGSVTLLRPLNGTNHILIKIWNATSLKLSIQGIYEIYTQGQFILQDSVYRIAAVTCSQANCLNCYNNSCLSCKEGYFLDPSSGACKQKCPIGTKGLYPQRVCAVVSCNTSNSSLLVERNSYCVWNCPFSTGYYYETATGCTSLCNNTCERCSGPVDNNCLSCLFPRYLTSNFTCLCPVGSASNAIGGCTSTSFLQLLSNLSVLTCQNLTIQAITRVDEQDANITFVWDVSSSDANSSSAIKGYLSSQGGRQIQIPRNLLVHNKTYVITAYYTNALSLRIQNQTTVEISLGYSPNFTVLNGNQHLLKNDINNMIQIQVPSEYCSASRFIPNATWTVASGNLSNINKLYNILQPLSLYIPPCTLRPGDKISLKANAWFTEAPNFSKEVIINITVLGESFEAYIQTDSKSYPETVDLVLDGQILYDDSCILRAIGDISYTWQCLNMSAINQSTQCKDNNGLFGVNRTSSRLVIPRSYYRSGDNLKFILIVGKNGVMKNDSALIAIKGPNTLIVDIVCEQSYCDKYVSNLDYMFMANVSIASSNGYITSISPQQNLAYNWTTDPIVSSAYFLNELKLFSNNDQTSLAIQIQLNVSNSTHSGSSYKYLPINSPPSQGTLTTLPTTGTPLSTYFTISADDWFDVDSPITYQFYYSYSPNSGFTPLFSSFETVSYVSIILPGPSSGGNIYIKADIRDAYGSETTVVKQILLQSDALTLNQSLYEYQNLISSAQQQGSFSVIQRAAMISKQLTDIENQILQNVSSPACPLCSGHGICQKQQDKCTCNKGWGLDDCSTSQGIIDEIKSLKQTCLEELNSNYDDACKKTEQASAYSDVSDDSCSGVTTTLYQTLTEISSYNSFNSNTSLSLVQNILENKLGILNTDTTLTSSEVAMLSVMLSNMISYSSTYDCSQITLFTQSLKNKMVSYLDKISESSLSSKIPAENATIIVTDNIDMCFETLSICDINSKSLSFGSDAPTITLSLNSNKTADCSTKVDLEYYAFSGNLFSCEQNSSNNTSKDQVSIGIKLSGTDDSGGLDISVSITLSNANSHCPSRCTKHINNACYCESISFLDMKDQVENMFANSKLAYFLNIQAILQYRFWTTVSFWVVASFAMISLASFWIIKRAVPNYNVLDNIHQCPKKSELRIFCTGLIVCFIDLNSSNRIRLCILF